MNSNPISSALRWFAVCLFLCCNRTTDAEVTVYTGTTQPFSIVFATDGTIYGVEYELGNRIFRIKDGKNNIHRW